MSEAKKSNLADSAIFVKNNVLQYFYANAQPKGLIDRANQIIATPGGEDETELIEFRLACQDIADREMQKIEFETSDAEVARKKRNAWTNFTSSLVNKVKHRNAS